MRMKLKMSSAGIESVDDFTAVFKKLLARARDIKTNGGVEPALTTQDFEGVIEEIGHQSHGSINRKYAAIETACRNIFYGLLVRLRSLHGRLSLMHSRRPHLSKILRLAKCGTFSTSCPYSLTSVRSRSINGTVRGLTRTEYCEPSLLFWLVEELLDTQTIDGCRIVFDYLDSRRERITAVSLRQAICT